MACISQVRYHRLDNVPNVNSVTEHCNVKCDSAWCSLPAVAYLAGNNGHLAEEQVHCSICLDVFTNPVSIPCGHNFCRCCILDYWKTTALFQCPMCKKTFKRPDISINTVLREIAEQFKDIRVINAERLQQQELKEERELQKKMEERSRRRKRWSRKLRMNSRIWFKSSRNFFRSRG
ncbi:E3 ubiquitin-protein ligase TRIM31-like [Oncorhynchus kisutch]|uniref:E3 ubiquitin-protein ligase TRIM31-like n=1 Tax=Oncorhynchus kisutch TaxID=8019 RepID=UPI0012DE9640|nr:E3 ubiquitin-protein ligase TRIM31-like [Oncorhynchus kisutch]